jgi:hypothetical protein
MSQILVFVVNLYNNIIFEKVMNDWYDCFMEALSKKHPKKSRLTEALMDLLSIEKESAYRRLRKEILFPAHELAKIASTWNISLDEIIGVNSHQVAFKVQLSDYVDPSAEQVKYIQKMIQVCNSPSMRYMEVSNKLPRSLTSGFQYLRRYQLLKWMYQFVKDDKRILPYSKIFFPAKISGLVSDYYQAVKNVANTTYIWDHNIFDFLVYDIRYFHSIYLITDEEKELIKQDLHAFLDYMSEVATKGCWPETGNEVNLHVSYINIDTNYNYYYSDDYKVCRVHAFAKSEIYSNDPEMIDDFVSWMQLKKRASVQISKTDEKSRIEFFMKWRETINAL